GANTSSIASLGNIGQANYAASKAGVIGLTRTLALEYAKYGITVNCVAPGPVMTRMLAGVPEAIREKIVARVPIGRIARPDEIAAVHAFLASDDAAYITGQVVVVAGGIPAAAGLPRCRVDRSEARRRRQAVDRPIRSWKRSGPVISPAS